MMKLYRINTGSCGGCDVAITLAAAEAADIGWAATPHEADALLLTGPITVASRDALLDLLQTTGERPLLVIGRCAIDGQPFGVGGVKAVPDITTQMRLDGCPPDSAAIIAFIRTAAQRPTRRARRQS